MNDAPSAIVRNSQWSCSGRYPHRHGLITLHEIRAQPAWFVHDFDEREAFQYLLPHDLQLHFRQPVADATMNTEAERHVLAGPRAVYDEDIGALDHRLVAVSRDVPHH